MLASAPYSLYAWLLLRRRTHSHIRARAPGSGIGDIGD